MLLPADWCAKGAWLALGQRSLMQLAFQRLHADAFVHMRDHCIHASIWPAWDVWGCAALDAAVNS